MNQVLKTWIIKRHEKLESADKQKFIRALKLYPDRVLCYIQSGIHEWGVWASVETREVVATNYDRDPQEILEALQKHFQADLSAITA